MELFQIFIHEWMGKRESERALYENFMWKIDGWTGKDFYGFNTAEYLQFPLKIDALSSLFFNESKKFWHRMMSMRWKGIKNYLTQIYFNLFHHIECSNFSLCAILL